MEILLNSFTRTLYVMHIKLYDFTEKELMYFNQSQLVN